MFAAQLLNIILLSVLLKIWVWDVFLALSAVAFLVVVAYAALSSLLAGIAVQARLKGLLLPLILLPLIFPLFFAALELSSALLIGGSFAWSSFWFKLLLLLDLLYLLLGLNLFEYVVKE
jgi:heme exporter protein B